MAANAEIAVTECWYGSKQYRQ